MGNIMGCLYLDRKIVLLVHAINVSFLMDPSFGKKLVFYVLL